MVIKMGKIVREGVTKMVGRITIYDPEETVPRIYEGRLVLDREGKEATGFPKIYLFHNTKVIIAISYVELVNLDKKVMFSGIVAYDVSHYYNKGHKTFTVEQLR